MDPLVIIGGAAALALLLRERGAPVAEPTRTAPVAAGRYDAGLGGSLNDALRGRSVASVTLPADGAFQARTEAAAAAGATGYRGGTSPPRVRSFAGVGQSTYRARIDGLPLSMARVMLPWKPIRWSGETALEMDLAPVLTVGGKRDGIRWSTDVGFNDADRWYGPTLIFDSDDVCWLADLGAYGTQKAGDSAYLGVGFDLEAIYALDAEHQATGASAEWSRAAWELDAPRIVQAGGQWALQGFGAAELAEGQRLNGSLPRRWLELVTGSSGEASLGVYQGRLSRMVWKPLIDRAKAALGRDAGAGYAAGEKIVDPLIFSR